MGYTKISPRYREFAVAFLRTAKHDLDRAENALEDNDFSMVIYFSQQCAEKIVKALLELEQIYITEHNIKAYFKKFIIDSADYIKYKNDLMEILNHLEFFEEEWKKPRYPRLEKGKVICPLDIYNRQIAENSFNKAHFVFDVINKIINEIHKIDLSKIIK